MRTPSILLLSFIMLSSCAPGPRSASDCGVQYRGGSGLLSLLAAMGAFDRPAGPDCTYSAPIVISGPTAPQVTEPQSDTDFGEIQQYGQPVISSGDCIGAVVNGVCYGTPAPGAPTATCYGQMIGGVCTGPMF